MSLGTKSRQSRWGGGGGGSLDCLGNDYALPALMSIPCGKQIDLLISLEMRRHVPERDTQAVVTHDLQLSIQG